VCKCAYFYMYMYDIVYYVWPSVPHKLAQRLYIVLFLLVSVGSSY